MSFWGRLLRRRRDEELDEEVRIHLRMATQERMEQGETAEQARASAVRDFGNITLVKEITRDMWRFRWVETFLQDLRYGVRQLRRNPGFTAVAVFTLALGIGANTAIFSVINGVLLRPLPYPQPDRLVWMFPANLHTGQLSGGAISPPDFQDYRARATAFDHLAAFLPMDSTLTGSGQAERVPSSAVSGGFFETLGVEPALGRTILTDDEQVPWPQVVVLSHSLWQARFGGDPHVIGKTVTVDGKGMTVVGVMPAGFEFPKQARLWNPLPFKYDEMNVRRFHFLRAVGRLKPGVTLDQSQAQMKSIGLALEKLYPDSNANNGVQPVLLQQQIVGDMRPTLQVLMIAVGFVLLVSCANVAHLLLARSAARHREIAIRSSLGASGGRLVRQLLTESVLLALVGGGLGILLAIAGLSVLLTMNPVNIPRLNQVHLDLGALAFTVIVSILTGLVFGLAPARRASKLEMTETLKEGGRGGSSDRSYQRFHNVLVGAEVAISLVLLIGAGLVIRSFARLDHVKPGFDPAGVLTLQISLPIQGSKPGDPYEGNLFFGQLLGRLRALPGVDSVALISDLPLSGQENDAHFTIEGRPPVTPSNLPDEDARITSAQYFRAMGIPLVQGRYFSDADNNQASRVAIVSRSFANKYFPNQNPIGQYINIDFGINFRAEIVGVVGDARHHSIANAPAPTMYVPYAQRAFARTNLVIHSRTPGLALLAEVKHEVQALNEDIPVYGVHMMDELVSDSVAEPRFRTLLLGTFAGIA